MHDRTRAATVFAVVMFLLTAIIGGGILVQGGVQRLAAPKDLQGEPVQLQDGDLPSGAVVRRMHVVAAAGIRFRVPSVGLDVGVGELSEIDGEITPPGFKEVYLVRNRGVGLAQAETGTVYVVTHSVRPGAAPGNSLIDVADGRSALSAGAKILVGDRAYTVTRAFTVEKTALASTADIWTDQPGRLVVVTCLQREQGRSLQNSVITAQLDR